jgi:hypothetical protein
MEYEQGSRLGPGGQVDLASSSQICVVGVHIVVELGGSKRKGKEANNY